MNANNKKRHETAKRRDGESARKPIKHFRDLDVYHYVGEDEFCEIDNA
jgi:hypothetical protein